ncbi:OmpA family protein [Teredinibacter franksiae]|uniref:OmpA family protein n=1 Tax=Teredinibacter franksiae TaxID=2761453 RepID=UPI001626CD6C|nr:OmpA family protein [Teredinibacter franksiae]
MKVLGQKSKEFKLQRAVVVSLAACLTVASYSANAGDVQTEGFTLAPSLGYLTHSESRQGAEDAADASIAAGYQFASPWALELAYTISEPGNPIASGDLDANQIRLDSLYHFGKSGKAQPYAVFGVGKNEISGGPNDVDETLLNAGVGLKYQLSKALSMRTDVRAIAGLDTDTMETAFNLGVHYVFGKKAAKSKPVSKPAAAAAPMPIKVTDTDGDGIADSADKCPNSDAGSKVDQNGCYRVLKEDVRVELNIQFANNSDAVVSDSFAQVEELATFMREFPLTNVEIKGHTDDRGAATYNKQLSQKRAQAVADILVDKYSIDASRITAKGYGEEQPVASNDTAAGRVANRRVEGVVSATVEKIIK